MKNIKISELKPDYNIIDIRSRRKYLKSHIYNAKNIDENNLIDMPYMYLDKNETYYIYCSSGHQSSRCCKLLEALGYDVVNVEDGFEEYRIV